MGENHYYNAYTNHYPQAQCNTHQQTNTYHRPTNSLLHTAYKLSLTDRTSTLPDPDNTENLKDQDEKIASTLDIVVNYRVHI